MITQKAVDIDDEGDLKMAALLAEKI